MKRRLFLLTLLLNFSLLSSGQSDLSYVEVAWKVGTEKTITQVDSTIIYVGGDLYMAAGIESGFRMKVVSLKDTVYEVLFQQIEIKDELEVTSDMIDIEPTENMLQNIIQELQEKMLGFEYSFLVSKNTAQAYQVKNEEEMESLIEEVVIVVLNSFFDDTKVEISDQEKKNMELQVIEYMDEQMPAAMQTMLNSFNYLFQAYTMPYTPNETITLESEVYSVDAIQHGEEEDMSTTFLIDSKIQGSNLNLKYTYVYDKKQAYQDYVVGQGLGDSVSLEEFTLDESVETDFSLKTSWIKNSCSKVYVVMGETVVRQISVVAVGK